MTDIVTKVSIGGQVVPIGGGSEGQEVVYLTQAEYDVLPASKLTDGKIYKIKTSGVAPTPGGGAVIDTVLSGVMGSSDTKGFYARDPADGQTYKIRIHNEYGVQQNQINLLNGSQLWTISNGYFYYTGGNVFYRVNLTTGDADNINVIGTGSYTVTYKIANGCFYFLNNSVNPKVCKKVSFNMIVSDSTESEFNSIPSGLYYKGLYYSQDNNDYVATDINGVEVKRYVGVGTVNGIYDDKLYKTGNSEKTVAYAIATI